VAAANPQKKADQKRVHHSEPPDQVFQKKEIGMIPMVGHIQQHQVTDNQEHSQEDP
jgi:hypothetical protein